MRLMEVLQLAAQLAAVMILMRIAFTRRGVPAATDPTPSPAPPSSDSAEVPRNGWQMMTVGRVYMRDTDGATLKVFRVRMEPWDATETRCEGRPD